MKAKYKHTNLIAEDWRALAQFYTEVFGCSLVPPERDFRGAELDAGTGLKDIHLTGAHLLLPGFGDSGPTIEIFNYNQLEPRPKTAVNRPGFGHIAFEVDNVQVAQQEIEAHGGHKVGEIVTLTTKTGSKVTWCYVTDPESNVIELQAWS
ncbi:MAG TPA: VOC family protein [Anaerolineales bacterium]|nr:VOC family protein [Anaerolineales bacterium]